MKKLLLLIAVMMTTSTFAMDFFAHKIELNKNVEGSDDSSGCGYGWNVTKGKTLSASSTRASTNSTASNTIAMTMGTSGCEKHSIVMKDREQEYFTEVNYENIVADMALGQGEYLTAFASVIRCSNVSAFANFAQANLNSIVSDSPMGMLSNVKKNSALQAVCL